MLYTIIALPNIFFPFFVGIIIDFLGIRIALIALTLGVVLFQTVVAIGVEARSYHTMLAGRMLFGICAESLGVVQACFVSYWFLGKELAFAIGLATTLPELGNALNSYVTPLVYEKTQSLSAPLFISVGICLLSFGCACVAALIDRHADLEDVDHNLRVVTDSEDTFISVEQEGIRLKDLKQLKGVFWLIVCLCMLGIAQYIPFLDNVNKLIQVRFCFSQVAAGRNVMVTYLVTSLLGFPIGIVVDKLGYKRYLIVIGMAVFLAAHIIIFVYPQCNPLAP
jgi:nitrate/nitrite transporter NarK